MPVTPAHCGQNTEIHHIAGSEGFAQDPSIAQAIAWMLFLDAWFKADASLRAYAAQTCPDGCKRKTPKDPLPAYENFQFRLRYDPGAAAKPAAGGHPAVPARAAAWICTIAMTGKVEFTCEEDVEG